MSIFLETGNLFNYMLNQEHKDAYGQFLINGDTCYHGNKLKPNTWYARPCTSQILSSGLSTHHLSRMKEMPSAKRIRFLLESCYVQWLVDPDLLPQTFISLKVHPSFWVGWLRLACDAAASQNSTSLCPILLPSLPRASSNKSSVTESSSQSLFPWKPDLHHLFSQLAL